MEIATKIFGAHNAIVRPNNPNSASILKNFQPLYANATCHVAIGDNVATAYCLPKLLGKLDVYPQKSGSKTVIISIPCSPTSLISVQTGTIKMAGKDIPYSQLFHILPPAKGGPKILYECFRTSGAKEAAANPQMLTKAKEIEQRYLKALSAKDQIQLASLMAKTCRGNFVGDAIKGNGQEHVQQIHAKNAKLSFPSQWFRQLRFTCHFDNTRKVFIVMTTGMCCVDEETDRPVAFTHAWTTGSDFKILSDIFRLNIA